MISKKKLKSYIFSSLIKAFIGTILFILIYAFSNKQITKLFAEDLSFDLLNKVVLENDTVNNTAPNVIIFGIDDYYFKSKDLLDEDNQTHYGDLFPRDKIANFISKIDKFSEKISIDKQPRTLFIDYDVSFTHSDYNSKMSPQDEILIEVLKQPRNYIILFPKNSKYNYIESSTDKKIQTLIKNNQIIFVSVKLAKAEDFVTKRYIPYESYKHSVSQEKQIYPHASILMWKMAKGRDFAIENFKKQDVVKNRIIIKSYKPIKSKVENYIHKQSNWESLNYYSANYPLSRIISEKFYNSFIFLGGTYKNSEDVFNVNSTQNKKLSGVEVHANALMTLFYFDGELKQYNFIKSILLVFIVFFIIDILINILFNKLKITSIELQIIISLIIITLIMIIISIYILVINKEWFNWFIPVLLFEIVEIIEFVNRYILKILNKENT